ncbi:MAG: helicase C-terminal domain-containing protein [Phycisphaerales bacterium]
MTGVESILGDAGPISTLLGEGYEPRDQQIAMSRAVERTLEERTHLLVEAGTGVGKSFAYLVPAMMRAITNRETVVVATNTIALQEQIVKKDIPLLDRALEQYGSCKSVLVKGRGNYMSIRRLKLASERKNKLLGDPAERRSLDMIEDWAYETPDGTLSTLPQLERQGVWTHVMSDSANCMGRKCPNYNACFYQVARREMEGAQLLVCNHALFFSDLALRSMGTGFLPDYDHVILDEAHGVEDAAADHFGLRLTEWRVSFLLNQLYNAKTGKGYLSDLTLQAGDIEPIEKAYRLVDMARRVCEGFFDDLYRLSTSGKLVNGRMREANMVENHLSQVMGDLSLRLKRIKEIVTREQDQFELNAYSIRAAEIGDHAHALLEQTMPNCVYWIESTQGTGRGGPKVTLSCSPIEVAPILREHLFGQSCSVVLTSATLSTRQVLEDEEPEHAETAFAHTLNRLGAEGSKTLQLGSPFDYRNQVRVIVDTTVPNPGYKRGGGGSGESFDDAIAARVHDQVIATDGGAFVLFTSFNLLYKTADRLRGPLESLGMRVWVHGRDGSRTQILDEFRQCDRGVLFGAASFWQGVDVRGSALRNVIITRLPFDPPDRPIVEARGEKIREGGGDPFRDDALPRAVIRFKQGFGRLIRSSTDMGQVVILDPRVLTTGYGRSFLKAIPGGVEVERI